MKSLRVSAAAASVLALSLAGSTVTADDNTPSSITVAFGTGNNNAAAGNTPNHHILPPRVTVRITKARKLDGTVVVVPATVNFTVAGFHWIWVYNDGVTLQEVKHNIPAAGLFVNYEGVPPVVVSNVFAKGVFPGTPPTFADLFPANAILSAAQNRVEAFAFSTPGTYLVICNIRGHLVDGMYAWVKVVDDDDHHDRDHDRGHDKDHDKDHHDGHGGGHGGPN